MRVQTSADKQAILQDKRGLYSIVNRRFTELTSGWTEYAVANAVATWNINHSRNCHRNDVNRSGG